VRSSRAVSQDGVSIAECSLFCADDVYFGDSKLFFRSMHGTLNHLAAADELWLGRLRVKLPSDVGSLWGRQARDWEIESNIETEFATLCLRLL